MRSCNFRIDMVSEPTTHLKAPCKDKDEEEKDTGLTTSKAHQRDGRTSIGINLAVNQCPFPGQVLISVANNCQSPCSIPDQTKHIHHVCIAYEYLSHPFSPAHGFV